GTSPQLRPLRHRGDEPCVIVANILHPFLEHREPVTLGGGAAGDSTLGQIATLGDLTRRAGGIERFARLDPMVLLEEKPALGEGSGMTGCGPQAMQRRSLGREEAMSHRYQRLGYRPQFRR